VQVTHTAMICITILGLYLLRMLQESGFTEEMIDLAKIVLPSMVSGISGVAGLMARDMITKRKEKR